MHSSRLVAAEWSTPCLCAVETFENSVIIADVHPHLQAQQLFQRDAQTITPEALENVKAALAIGDGENKSDSKKRALPRKAAGQTWEDPTLGDWPESASSIIVV